MFGHRCWLFVPLLLALVACGEQSDPPAPRVLPLDIGRDFDPDSSGSITGLVRWSGSVPTTEPFRSIDEPLTDQPPSPARDWPNPNAPRINSDTALAGAIVFLRGVDPRKARPWDHPAVRVELQQQTYRIRQGDDQHVGFVRPGDPIDLVSRDDRLHVVQARGADFFSLALPSPNVPRIRRFTKPGVVELRSGSGYFWMRAYLLVSDHPYLTRTDNSGRFRLDHVPAGEYDLVVWHPSWEVAKELRNPDLFRVQQVEFAPPLESVQRVHVRTNQTTEANGSLSPVIRR